MSPTSSANPPVPTGAAGRVALTPFVGRQTELASLQDLLARARLLNLTGPGGIGKTRLALRAGQLAAPSFPDGVYFVDLQARAEDDGLPMAMMEALDLRLTGPDPAATQLLHMLQPKRLLLILDGFEQLHSGSAFLSELLQVGLDVKLMVTSRQALNLREEWLFAVTGLSYPPKADADDLASFSAIELFSQTAKRLRPDFSLTPEEETGVVRICQLVEGMPLALELAAAWVTTLTCREIADEIARNLSFLAARTRNIPEAHRSIRAVFASSWSRLAPAEQSAFARLSVFPGSFRRKAAEELAQASLLTLSILVDQSLLEADGDGRFHVHALLRQFAFEQLAHSTEVMELARQHAQFYCALVARRADALQGGQQKEALQAIEDEWDNVRAAWRWAVAHGDVPILLELIEPLNLFCDFRGRYLEAIEAFEAARAQLATLDSSADAGSLEAQLLGALAGLYLRIGQLDRAEQLSLRGMALAHKLPELTFGYGIDPRFLLGIIASAQGNYTRARELGEAVLRAIGDHEESPHVRGALYLLGRAHLLQNDPEQAHAYFQRCYLRTQQAGDRWFLAYCLIELGNLQRTRGRPEAARRHFAESYAIRAEFDDPEGMAVALENLGLLALEQGRYAEATEHFEECVAIARPIQNRGLVAGALYGLGAVALETGEAGVAAQRFSQAMSIAVDAGLVTQLLTLLVEVGRLLAPREPLRANELFQLVREHPGSTPAARARAEAAMGARVATSDLAPAGVPDWQQLTDQALTLARELALGAVEETAPDPDASRAGRAAQDASGQLVEPLTERELEVLALLAEGHSNAEIADRLVLAVGTVKYYTSEIYGKLGVRNRVEAVGRAREFGILT